MSRHVLGEVKGLIVLELSVTHQWQKDAKSYIWYFKNQSIILPEFLGATVHYIYNSLYDLWLKTHQFLLVDHSPLLSGADATKPRPWNWPGIGQWRSIDPSLDDTCCFYTREMGLWIEIIDVPVFLHFSCLTMNWRIVSNAYFGQRVLLPHLDWFNTSCIWCFRIATPEWAVLIVLFTPLPIIFEWLIESSRVCTKPRNHWGAWDLTWASWWWSWKCSWTCFRSATRFFALTSNDHKRMTVVLQGLAFRMVSPVEFLLNVSNKVESNKLL